MMSSKAFVASLLVLLALSAFAEGKHQLRTVAVCQAIADLAPFPPCSVRVPCSRETLLQCVTMCELLQEEAFEAKEVWEWSSTAAASWRRAGKSAATSAGCSCFPPTLTARGQKSCKSNFYCSPLADRDWRAKERFGHFLMFKMNFVSDSGLIFAVLLSRTGIRRFAWTPRPNGWRIWSKGSCPSKYCWAET